MIAGFRDWLKGGAALMAVVYLVGYLGAFLHTTTEVHVVCSEHGDLIHADEHVAEAEPASANTQIKASETHNSHHDHCALAQLVQSAQGASSDQVSVLAPPFFVATVLEPDTLNTPIRGPTIRLVLLAPKTSPPIA